MGRKFPEIAPAEKRELGTVFYDAIYFSVTEELAAASVQRRALIVFSDGEENSSKHDLLDAIGVAQTTDALVYCIGTRKASVETPRRAIATEYAL